MHFLSEFQTFYVVFLSVLSHNSEISCQNFNFLCRVTCYVVILIMIMS